MKGKSQRRSGRRVSEKSGLPPGTMIHIGDRKVGEARMHWMAYSAEAFNEREGGMPLISGGSGERATVTWLNITGLHDNTLIHQVGERFGIHPLTLEDIVNTHQRPKVEEFKNYLYVVLKMLSYDHGEDQVRGEQVSFILGRDFLISFQENEGDVFDGVRDRVRKSGGRIRSYGPDYLLYALMDAIVDQYFVILETVGERIDVLEETLLMNLSPALLGKIHRLKRECLYLSRKVWPLREVLTRLTRDKLSLIDASTGIFFRDVYDHTIQVIEGVEIVRDLLSGVLDLYVSMSGNRLNEVMKVLTLIATIFIPLTFIAGVYGMNFKYMPELEWRWGYPLAMLFMAFLGAGMFFYFKKKKWL